MATNLFVREKCKSWGTVVFSPSLVTLHKSQVISEMRTSWILTNGDYRSRADVNGEQSGKWSGSDSWLIASHHVKQ